MSDGAHDAEPRIAVLVPCRNEEATVAKVVSDFRCALPQAAVYVCDNASTDRTAAEAASAGAEVIYERRPGKGAAVGAMLATIDADYYVLADGDDTYPAECAADLLQPLLADQADMVVGQRLSEFVPGAFRPWHLAGNRMIAALVNVLFSVRLTDVMSGYRTFTREFAEAVPVTAVGFDLEPELTLQAIQRQFVICEAPVVYRPRPAGGCSKLRTFRDGLRVIVKIVGMFVAYRPMRFFGGLGLACWLTAIPFAARVFHPEFARQGAGAAATITMMAALLVGGMLLAAIGIVLHVLAFRLVAMERGFDQRIGRVRRGLPARCESGPRCSAGRAPAERWSQGHAFARGSGAPPQSCRLEDQ
jgi:hypothetical protein